ncbi:RCC1 domain-containing protein [Allofournierella sp.]|uniref:RCC1 domain-containing protein n=1 Tax=Allofournierella sp. TaxID=1940256 RepID=UPI003AEF1B42
MEKDSKKRRWLAALALVLVLACLGGILFAVWRANAARPAAGPQSTPAPADLHGAQEPAALAAAPMVAAGQDSTFYLDAQGTLWAWGCNQAGQLGDGTQADSGVPVKVMEGVAQVSCGGQHTVAVKADGSLWGWGLCQSGRLLDTPGDATYYLGDRGMPVQTTPVKLMDGVSQAAAGPCCTLILKTDGSLWSTGGLILDENGQWQDDDEGLIRLLDDVVSCAAGYDSASAIRADGTLFLWPPIKTNDPAQAARYHKPVENKEFSLIQTSYNYGQLLSVQTDGTLFYYGLNDHGQGLGESNGERYGLPSRRGTIALEAKAVQAGCGVGYCAAVDENGALWMWGCGEKGQLGNGQLEDAAAPVKVMDGVAQVACGFSHTVALKTDGTVWCWGGGGEGQIGPNAFGQADYFCPLPLQMDLQPPASAVETTLYTGQVLRVDGTDKEHWFYAVPESEAGFGKSYFYPTLGMVAALLEGTPAQFTFDWDEQKNTLHITTGEAYGGTGDELTPPAGPAPAEPATAAVFLDGREIFLRGYVIGGEPAYVISDLCAVLGAQVGFSTEEGISLLISTAPILYDAALADARTVEPEEVIPLKTSFTRDNPYAIWNDAGDRVLVATWNDTPDAYPAGRTVTIGEEAVWVFSGAELKAWYGQNSQGVTDWHLRLCQLIGLPPATDYDSVTLLWVDPGELVRPAYDPDITSGEMSTTLSGDDWFRGWFARNEAASYGEGGYPWTRLGYTYDWADNGTEYGLTEFIIKPGATAAVEETVPTADYLAQLAG